ncbi:hypothetical protein FQZ97_1112020 [compost metagenome]
MRTDCGISPLQQHRAPLVRGHAPGQEEGARSGDQAGEVIGDEPGAVVDHHGAKLKGVALENDGGVCVMHGGTPTSQLRPAAYRCHSKGGSSRGVDRPASRHRQTTRVSPRDLP